MRSIQLADFSGGLSEVEAADDFAADSLARAHGVVLDTPVTLRSQWQLQEFSGSEFVAVRGFSSGSNYLVGVKSDGSVWWSVTPDDNAASPQLSWTQFSGIASVPGYRFLADIPYQASQQTITNVDPDTEASTSFDVTLYGKNGLLLNTNTAGTVPVVVYESAPGILAATPYAKVYPALVSHPTIANYKVPEAGVMPRGNVGVVWGDRLVLGDIQWYASTGTDQTLNDGTVTRYQNALWFSEAGAVDTYDPLSVVVPCSSEATIVDLQVIDLGLLVFTTSASGRDGVVLLRGTPGNFRVEVLRSGLAAPRRTTSGHTPFAANWAETGTVVFVDHQGSVWQTNGSGLVRVDGLTLAPPATPATDLDHCVTLGPWLFVSRGTRLLVMRSFRETGAWTELIHPSQLNAPGANSADATVKTNGVTQVRSMTVVGESVYFLADGVPYRFAVGYTAGPRGTLRHSSSHGAGAGVHDHNINGITVSTPTVAVPQKGDPSHSRALWHRVGVRVSGEGQSSLERVEVHVGPALAPLASYAVVTDEATSGRFERVVPAGIGFALEASATFVFAGDNSVESVTLWFSGGEPVR